MTMKRFGYNFVGYKEIEAESEEDAEKKLWNVALGDADVEIDSLEITEAKD